MLWKRVLIVGLAVGASSVPVAAQRADSLPALERRIDRLQAKVESIESVRAIKRLQYAYGHYVEFGLWNDFADLFTDDAVTNYVQGARGRDGVRKLFFDQVGQGKLGLADGRIYPHILFQPVITLAPDGRSAKGRWRILAMLGGYGGTATWYSGVYENEYVRDGGVWKIAVLHSEPKVTAAYSAAGWKESGTRLPFHFTTASVTTPIPDAVSAKAANNGGASLQTLAERVGELARRAETLKDQGEVTNLQDSYGYAVDGRRWDQAANLFASDGTLELGMRGVYVGKTSIRHAFDQFGPQGLREGERNDHVYLQTLVSVAQDGRTANARGVEVVMSSTSGGELSEGVFENSFVKQGGGWKIQSVHFYPRMIVDAATGWAKSAKPAPGPSKDFPPDRAPTVTYEIYPKFAVAPFHFDNPVTGKAPQYPERVLSAVRPTTASIASPPPREAAIRSAGDMKARLADVERGVNAAEAYDAAEKLIGAYGYYLDEKPGDMASLFAQGVRDGSAARPLLAEGTVFVNQVLQPVIDIAPDGRSAKVRARLLDLGGTSGGPGYWTAGELEGQIISQDGGWKFQAARSTEIWSAKYPGGWGQTRIP